MKFESEGYQLEKYAELVNPYSEQPPENAIQAAKQIYSKDIRARELRSSTPKEDELSERKSTGCHLLEGGSNESLYVTLKDDGSVVFKPQAGEHATFRTVEPGTYFQRERAAYLVSRFLDFELVPPTVIREIDGRIGSTQEFIPNTKLVGLYDNVVGEEALYRQWVFDLLIWNSDRHGKNFLITPKNTVVSIDNCLSFANDEPKLFGRFIDVPVTSGISELMRNITNDPSKVEILTELLEELLPKEEVRAFEDRLNILAAAVIKRGRITAEDVRYNSDALPATCWNARPSRSRSESS